MNKYLNFDLEISKRADKYLARVIASPNGEARNLFDFPFDQQQLDAYIKTISHTRSFILNEDDQNNPGENHGQTADEVAQKIRQFGRILFDAVFQKTVSETYRESKVSAQNQQAGLRIRLRFPESPELISVPWEFLFDPRTDSFISLSGDTSIVRYMELNSAAQPMQITPPLKILVVISNPRDFPRLDIERERVILQQSLKPLEQKHRIQLVLIEHATLRKITTTLSNNDFHVIHFIGHGDFNHKRKEGVIIIEDDQGRGLQVSSRRIATLFQGKGTTRLIVLNACEGGITSEKNIFSGVAQSVVKKGIPAVLAMQYAITDESAIIFSETFYQELSKGSPIDTSLSMARRAIYNQINEIEFGTAALYMRAKTGRLFGKDKTKFLLPNELKVEEKRPKHLTFAIAIATSIALLTSFVVALIVFNTAVRFI